MIDPKIIQFGKELIELAEKYSDPKILPIVPEPRKDKCVHEPKVVDHFIVRPFKGICEADVYIHECRHCGIRIRAEKWVEYDKP